MKSKSIFLMVVSLGFGLVAAVGITQVMGRKTEEPKEQVATRSVLVAVEDIDINKKLTEDMFVEDQWPEELVLEDFVTSFDEIENKVTRSRVRKRGPLYLTDLVHVSEANVLAIPSGYKVVGIKIAADDHLMGLLQPGDYVDVIGVFRGNRSTSMPTSRTFLKKIQVFKVADSLTRQFTREDASAKGSTVVGLLVTEQQSEQIVLVQRMAEIKLAIRGPDENNDLVSSQGTGFDSLWPELAPTDTTPSPVVTPDPVVTFEPQPPVQQPEPAGDQETFEMWIHDETGSTKYVFSDGQLSEVVNSFAPQTPQPVSTPAPPQQGDSLPFDDGDFNDDGFDIDSDPLSDQFDSELED